MIASTRYALSPDVGLAARSGVLPRPVRVTLSVALAPGHRPASGPRPRRLATSLDTLLGDGVPVRDPTRARAAARAFAAGDGFLPGQLIDRTI